MRVNTASVLSVCLLALRVGVTAAPTENINSALIIDDDHNTTSLAGGHFSHGKTGIEFPVPVADLEKRKGRSGSSRTSRKPTKTAPKKTTPKKKKTPSKTKSAKAKVTSKATLHPTKSKSVSKTASKTKSAKDPYGSCKPKKGAKSTKGKTTTKGKKGAKREEGFTPISDEQFHSLAARDRKTLEAGRIFMEFPTHPSGGDAIRVSRYQRDGMKAFGTRDPDPCDDDYNLRVVTFPSAQGVGLVNGERWDTEHVMDAQIIQQFFEYLNDHLPVSGIPAEWWSQNRNTGQVGKFTTVRAERYMGDFWDSRKGSGGITAMDYLLQVYPGTNQHTGELALLGHNINRKKESIFAAHAGSCVGSTTWRNLDYWGKVDALRECILLAKYMNHSEIRASFKAVAERIRDRLTSMESQRGFMSSTRDYWAVKKNNNKYRDAAGEAWTDQRLDDKWEAWLTSYMRSRLNNLASEITTKLHDISRLNTQAQRDRTLSQTRRDRIAQRYRRIDRAWTGIGSRISNPSPF